MNLLDNIICYANDNGYLNQNNLGISIQSVNSFIDNYLYDNELLDILNHISQSGNANFPSVELVSFGESIIYNFSSSSISLSNTYKSQICDYANLGYPVIVHLFFLVDDDFFGYDIDGHTAIAYSTFFHSGLEPVYHLGYSDLTNCWISGDYVISGYDVIYPITFSNHTCSSNYINISTNNPICPHELLNHEHIFVNHSPINSLKHNKYCYCSYVVSERHNFSNNGFASYCIDCGYIANNEHPILRKDENF